MRESNINLQFLRVLALYRQLPRSPAAYISIDQLENCLHFGKRKTLQRDLDLLNKSLATGKIEKIVSKGRTPAQYRLSSNAIIEQFSPELALSLMMANSFLEQHVPPHVYCKVSGLFQSADKQLEKYTHLKEWNSRIRFIHDGYCQHAYQLAPAHVIELLYQAMMDDHSWIKIQYQREYDNDILDYVIRPHGMINRGRKQFIIAHKIENNSSILRTFCLHRIRDIQPAQENLCVDVDSFEIYQAIEDQQHEYALFDREIIRVKLRCDDVVHPVFEESEFGNMEESEFGNMIELGETSTSGYFYVLTDILVTETVLNWLVEKAHQVRVIHPEKLAREIKTRIQQAVDLYAYDDFDNDCLLENDDLAVEDNNKPKLNRRNGFAKPRVTVINTHADEEGDDLEF